MKQYSKIAGLAICSLALLASCKDWDFEADNSYEKLFRTPKLETEELEATYANLVWNKVPNADYYLVELSKDSLTFTTDLKVFGGDKSIHVNEFKIADLLGGIRYSVRIKACSDKGIPESEYSTLTFKTKTEQILNEVTTITGKSAVISWEAALQVDKLVITGDGGLVERILTAAEIVAGEVTLNNLVASTEYQVTIWVGTTQRGKRTFSTTESFPDGYTIVNLKADDVLSDVMVAQTGKVVIVFPVGNDMQLSEAITVPENITSVIFWGATGGTEKSKFSPKGLTAAGDLEVMKFYNLTLYNAGPSADYVLNQGVLTQITTFSIENCEVKDSRGVIRVQGAGNGSTIENIEIVNNVFTNIGSFGIVSTKDMTNLNMKTITMSKSTFNTVNAGAILNVHQENLQIAIDQCTFYNCVTNGKSFIDVNKITTIGVSMNNTIVSKSYNYSSGNTIKAASLKDIITASNVYSTSDCVWALGYAMGMAYDKISADFFEDPANGNFKIKDPAFTPVTGDPRWKE